MIPLCRARGVGMIPWSPLARGLLTGTRSRQDLEPTLRARTDDYGKRIYQPEKDWEIVQRLVEVAEERGDHPASVALAWLLAKEGVAAPIIGTTDRDHLRPCLDALDVELSAEETERLEEPYYPHEVQGHN